MPVNRESLFKNFLKSERGFTLSEVLIVLAIIGIVAALAIPALITNIQNQTYITAWKKTYSSINMATTNMLNDMGGDFTGQFPADYYAAARWFAVKYQTYLNTAKYCQNLSQPTDQGCWHYHSSFTPPGARDGDHLFFYNGDTYASNMGGYPAILLSDGTMILFNGNNDPSCGAWWQDTHPSCGIMVIDTNGFKGPDTVGKDIFFVHIRKNKIEPYGVVGDGWGNDCLPGSHGYTCASRLLLQ